MDLRGAHGHSGPPPAPHYRAGVLNPGPGLCSGRSQIPKNRTDVCVGVDVCIFLRREITALLRLAKGPVTQFWKYQRNEPSSESRGHPAGAEGTWRLNGSPLGAQKHYCQEKPKGQAAKSLSPPRTAQHSDSIPGLSHSAQGTFPLSRRQPGSQQPHCPAGDGSLPAGASVNPNPVW